MGGFYVADKKTCEEFDMTMSKQQFYDLAGVPIRRIFEILAQEQGKTPDLDAMAARCKVSDRRRVIRVPPARIETPDLESRPASRPGSLMRNIPLNIPTHPVYSPPTHNRRSSPTRS